MVKPDVVYHFDFGSPNCYLLHKLIPALEQRTGATVKYLPILLGGLMKSTNNQPPLMAFANISGKNDYILMEIGRYVKRHKIEPFRFNPDFPINTLLMMRGAIAAERLDCFAPYVDACFHAMWGEPVNMGDPDVVKATLLAAGLPADEILALTQDPDVKQALLDNTAHSAERGNFGAPTVYVGEEMFFGKENIELIEEEIAAQSVDG
jgi:2-hydroxychromene-2-carboxylate isomerase